jgi:uncharacterized protein YigA (DUF484 family)
VLTDDDVVRYLRNHPEFFSAHADLLASITVPHPHGGRAISLQERQLEVLREKNRALEAKLAGLVRIGQDNDAIGEKLQKWTRQLLLAPDPDRLPQLVVDGMLGTFAVPHVALRLWSVREAYRGMQAATPVEVDAITLANSM